MCSLQCLLSVTFVCKGSSGTQQVWLDWKSGRQKTRKRESWPAHRQTYRWQQRNYLSIFLWVTLLSVCLHPSRLKMVHLSKENWTVHVIESKWCWSFLSYKKVTNAFNDMKVKYSFNLNLINVPEHYTAMYFPPHCNNLSEVQQLTSLQYANGHLTHQIIWFSQPALQYRRAPALYLSISKQKATICLQESIANSWLWGEGSSGGKIKLGQSGRLSHWWRVSLQNCRSDRDKRNRCYSLAHHLQVCMIVPSSELDMKATWGRKRWLGRLQI